MGSPHARVCVRVCACVGAHMCMSADIYIYTAHAVCVCVCVVCVCLCCVCVCALIVVELSSLHVCFAVCGVRLTCN